MIPRQYLSFGQVENLQSTLKEAAEKLSAAAVPASPPAPVNVSKIFTPEQRPHAYPCAARKAVGERMASVLIEVISLMGKAPANRAKFIYDVQKAVRDRADLEQILRAVQDVSNALLKGQNWRAAMQRALGRHQVLGDVLERHGSTISVLDLA